MNLLEHHVVEVLGEPVCHEYEGKKFWTVRVKANSWGRLEETDIFFLQEKQPTVAVGDIFKA